MSKHPGKVTFVEKRDGVVVKTEARDVETLPESLRFEQVGSKRVPVVRIETIFDGSGPREILKYGPGGKFINSTIVAPRR